MSSVSDAVIERVAARKRKRCDFMYYNFGRIHQTLRVTPAMDAGVASHVWSVEEVVALLW